LVGRWSNDRSLKGVPSLDAGYRNKLDLWERTAGR
jgi:hypothetical protein